MSKGHGVVQRTVIDQLERQPDRALTLRTLTGVSDPTPSQYESTRRAVDKLAAEGVVGVVYVTEPDSQTRAFVRLTEHYEGTPYRGWKGWEKALVDFLGSPPSLMTCSTFSPRPVDRKRRRGSTPGV